MPDREWMGVVVALAAIVFALLGVLWQICSRREAERIECAVQLHKDLTTGEVGAARAHLAGHYFRDGNGVITPPTWSELKETSENEHLNECQRPTLLDDYYTILWCFQRIQVAYEKKILARNLANPLFARHVWWWTAFSKEMGMPAEINAPTAVESLNELKDRLELTNDEKKEIYRDFGKHD